VNILASRFEALLPRKLRGKALDASVGSLVFERVTKRLRNSNAATVVVTNDPSLPRRCDRVILMGQAGKVSSSSSCSRIIDSGTYDELLRRRHNLQTFSSEDNVEGPGYYPNPSDVHNIGDDSVDEEISRHTQPKREMIRVMGGYKVRENRTDQSCHADPECNKVDLQHNPDFIVERVNPTNTEIERELNGNEGSVTAKETVYDAPFKSVGRETKLLSPDDNMSTEAVPFSTYTGYLKTVGSPKLIVANLLHLLQQMGLSSFSSTQSQSGRSSHAVMPSSVV
jgi:hypothetical protein